MKKDEKQWKKKEHHDGRKKDRRQLLKEGDASEKPASPIRPMKTNERTNEDGGQTTELRMNRPGPSSRMFCHVCARRAGGRGRVFASTSYR